jgi:hypothetical protein
MSDDPMEQGLVCEGEIPLGWERVTELPPEQRLAAINAANESLIRSCEGLEEPYRSYEESSDLAQELQRLDAKLTLVLDMLAEALRRPEDLPPGRRVRFNAHGISWELTEARQQYPEPGALIRIECYVCAFLPKPLVMYGRMSGSAEDAAGRVPERATVEFVGISQGLADALERLVFRRHRREVAQLRGQRRGGLPHD